MAGAITNQKNLQNQIRAATIERIYFESNIWNPTICSTRNGYCIGRDIDFIVLSEPLNLKKPKLVNKAELVGYFDDRSMKWQFDNWDARRPI